MKWLYMVVISVILVGCGGKNNSYENKVFYEYKKGFWKNKYVEVTLPVVASDKVPTEFYTERTYFTKEGESYTATPVKVVNVAQWKVVEERRKSMLNKFFVFFLSIAACGFIGILAGLFCMWKQIVLWDELLVGGGLSFVFGLTSAWYCDYLPLICTGLVLCIIGMAVYMLISRRKVTKKDVTKTGAIKDIMTTVERLKASSRDKWEDVKGQISHSEETEEYIKALKDEVMESVMKEAMKKIYKTPEIKGYE